ncbi:MAG TPA: prephenate dehydratase [Ktedonobacteraceae bacterium]
MICGVLLTLFLNQKYFLSSDIQTLSHAVTIAFQGERGAFGDAAARAYFCQEGQSKPDFVPYRRFADVFRAVSVGDVDYGLVPIENSQAGSVNDVYDLLCLHDLFVIGEISYPVNQCLLCLPGQQLSDIKRVISHPQALAQSNMFLQELGAETIATYNTAGSAKLIREKRLQGVAAVASATAAKLYELEILADSIQTIKDNYTRFIALGREPAPHCTGPAKTMLVMAISHQPGSLSTCLGILAVKQINLLKLESRPLNQRTWEYLFFLDFEGHCEDPAVRNMLVELASQTTFCKVLGSFARKM